MQFQSFSFLLYCTPFISLPTATRLVNTVCSSLLNIIHFLFNSLLHVFKKYNICLSVSYNATTNRGQIDRKMIGGFYKKHHEWDKECVAPSGSGRSVNFISKYKVLFIRKFSVLLNILLCGKKLKFVGVGHGSRVGLRKHIFSDGAKVIVHLFWGSSLSLIHI